MLVSSAKKKHRNVQHIDDIAQRADILSLELLDLHCISLQFQLFSQNYPPELITVSLKHLETLAEMIYLAILLTLDCEVIKNNNFRVRTVKQCSKTKTLQNVLILRAADSCRFPANRTNAITHVSLFVSSQRNDITEMHSIRHSAFIKSIFLCNFPTKRGLSSGPSCSNYVIIFEQSTPSRLCSRFIVQKRRTAS